MITSKATTRWQGGLSDGKGLTSLGSGTAEVPVDWRQRSTGEGTSSTPEELLAAAHSACFAMALSNALEQNGTPPLEMRTDARVQFVPGEGITWSMLTVHAHVPGLDPIEFGRIAEDAKDNCPMSKALGAIDVSLESATLQQ
ncbi:OsmC family peroxiredoxin [Demequina capsici]|uniref:OsmC family peroxiredoxin n=1 Tax=Demequina capsici TaxID=3075620 RepID=A0AA96JH80_9MICO|nr:OsmC family peroxiredoxin [Demequina sp. PMTSA13]WNM28724.1 OsmC family peroxiredoxin [Demequina sp. PMTSA13]